MDYIIGQRWASDMEPELGIGEVTKIDPSRITLLFPETNVTRQYSTINAPIKRIKFNIGEIVTSNKGDKFSVTNIEEKNGLIIYHGDKISLDEKNLSGTISFNSPFTRLLSKKFDTKDVFDLRYKSLLIKNKILKSNIHGFVGSKIELIPHQIFIAEEVSKRLFPRVLLSDEVGLGKTIEACLIIHRLIVTAQISRVLILVPESLIYQWFAELLHRFNLVFRIVNAQYCKSLMANIENPFYDGELCIASINFLSKYENWQKQAILAEWDMIVVDEVHNIKEDSKEFSFIEKLTTKIKRVLLLTATPEQFGYENHFARLRLLEPERYYDYNEFLKEVANYTIVAKLAEKIIKCKKLTEKDEKKILQYLGDEDCSFIEKLNLAKDGDKKAIDSIVNALVDRHGIGRVMFRNTRKAIKNFPKKIARINELKEENNIKMEILKEFNYENDINKEMPSYNYRNDPRVQFVSSLLLNNKNEKFLLIAHSKEKVIAIQDSLKKRGNFKTTVFHEDLKIIERDRNAAWFAASEGAQILICSEIGSEGRNFQFTNNLILFDLPLNPELLEQRIGRLDRIGQKKAINIYIPYIPQSPDEILAKWYHLGLNAFESNIPDGNLMFEKYSESIKNLAKLIIYNKKEIIVDLEKIISETKLFHTKNMKLLESGRDRLLELNSFNIEKSEKMLEEINLWDNDHEIEDYMHHIFEYFGIKDNPIDLRTYLLTPGNIKTDAFPKIDEDGITISYDRQKAIKKENILFLNWDHPYISRAIDLMLGNEYGNASIGIWYSNEEMAIFVETIYILECIAPPEIYINKYLPPTPIRVVINQKLEDCTNEYSTDFFKRILKHDKLFTHRLINNEELVKNILPEMIEKSKQISETNIDNVIQESLKKMRNSCENEIIRLNYLKKINKSIKDEEIENLQNQISILEKYIKTARLRLDSLRIIWKRKIE
ncbi:MAG: hypothetical protein A2086_06115 [Spirochaetes bacterium GWD1_27_9]|nr:MAG: hypothetical protein A2086_06115 [Spirochaetes bacterium GWD1_27_9]